jgi:hypothetical protein
MFFSFFSLENVEKLQNNAILLAATMTLVSKIFLILEIVLQDTPNIQCCNTDLLLIKDTCVKKFSLHFISGSWEIKNFR